MKLPRDVSGADLIKTLCRKFGYVNLAQEGSHVILQTLDPRSHRLSVPYHATLRLGTLHGIVKAVAQAKGVFPDDIIEALR